MDAANMICSIRNEKLTKGGREMIDDLGNFSVEQSDCRYEVGDMVWGKVKSHPWWPGQIFHEAFALPCVSKTKRDGHVLVAFFGDNSYGWFDPFELIPFDTNYVEKLKQTNDSEFINAVKDAEEEACRRVAIGLLCQCRGTCNFRATGVKGFVEVDVCGYQPGVVYSEKKIKNARDGFQPFEMLCFLKKLAATPHSYLERRINLIKNGAIVLAYRKAVFEEVDEIYVQACEAQPMHGESSIETSNLEGKMPSEVHTFGSMSVTLATGLSGKETRTIKKKSLLKEISLTKTLVYREADSLRNWDLSQDFQELQPKVLRAEKISRCLENVEVVSRNSPLSDALPYTKVIVTSSDGMDEKSRVLKYNIEDLHSEETHMINNKKKKIENTFKSGLEFTHNHLKNAKRVSVDGACNYSSDFMPAEKIIGFRRVNSDLPQLLSHLSGLALTPFHSAWHNIPVTMLQFFLEFRSVVYKKVTVVPAEAEPIETSSSESPSCIAEAKSAYNGIAQELPSALKPPKKRLKSNDYGNVGLIGMITDCGKQMSMEEPKRLNEQKPLTEEKKVGKLKPVKSLERNGRINVTVPTKSKKYSHEKPDTSKRVTESAMIVIQFPYQSTLPSVSELKARFARFGQLESPPRVLWKSSTCQVPFKLKSNAEAAYGYAIKNRSLFGSTKVEYYLRALEPSATEFSRPGKQIVGKASDEDPQVKPVSTCESTISRSRAPQHQTLHPSIQQITCLKKKLNDEATNVPNETPHVTTGVEQAVANSNTTQGIDISAEMLNLLLRCHEIVSQLKCSLGYVPVKL